MMEVEHEVACPARLKRVRAVELLAEGSSYEEIARQVGFTNRGSAHRAVSKALAEREVESIDEFRELELARLDQLQVAVWDDAMNGQIKAIDVVLRIMGKRDRLLGLDKPRSPATPRGILLSDWS
ncbi:hypothetical protein [Nocardioides mangrovicus]|uniref:hypothetical protein n=1 Tax=Nocardioides mangrovicus TaxID=2478913 RepID=UPI001314B6D9|nr:hypothetical protein [Nocardioides mangrovicus]